MLSARNHLISDFRMSEAFGITYMAARRSVSFLLTRGTLGFTTRLVFLDVEVFRPRFLVLGRAMMWCKELWTSTSTMRQVYSRLVLGFRASV